MKAPYCKHARCFLLFIAICLVVAGFPVHRLEAQQTNLPPEIIAYADTVLYNGKILTADDGFNVVEAVAIRDGKFLAVGTTDRIVPMAGPNTRKIDLGGRTAMPGIIDLHQHPFTEGMMNYWDNKWLPEIPRRVYGQDWINAEEAVAGIKGAVERAKPGEMVMIPRTYVQEGIAGGGGKGKNFCELVTLAEIDAVSGDTPVFFLGIVNLSAFAVNSKAASLIQPFLPEGVAVFREEGKACLATGGDIWGKASPYGGREGEGGEKEAFRGREAMVQAVRFGWDVSADHTVGDRSVHEVLKAFEEGLDSQLVKRPNQHLTINHTPLVRLEDIQKMKELGVIASIGSWHILFPPMLEAALAHQGVERVHNMLPDEELHHYGIEARPGGGHV